MVRFPGLPVFGASLAESGGRSARGATGPQARLQGAPEAAALDTHLQAVEQLRDTSHVRDYTTSEWIAALGRSGFTLQTFRSWRLRMDLPTSIARMQTPPDNVRAIRALQTAASREISDHFEIEADGSFMLDVMMIETTAA
jgi:hypothetical protein